MTNNNYVQLSDGPDEEKEQGDAKPWSRLVCVLICCSLLSGLAPGAPVWGSLLASGGLFGHVCNGQPIPCDSQFITIGMLFATTCSLSSLMLLVTGLLFDSLGGRAAGALGGVMLAIGYTLLLVTIVGSDIGEDQLTSLLFVPAVFIIDCGSMCASQGIQAMVFHFPDSASIIFSLYHSTVAVAALLPMFIEFVMGIFGVSLPFCLFVNVGIMVVCTFGLWFSCPSKQEYLEQAEKVLGQKIDMTNPGVCKTLYDSNRILQQNWKDHAVFLIFVLASNVWATIYASNATDYARHLFNDEQAGNTLANLMVVMSTCVGIFVVPLVSYLCEKYGMKMLIASCAVMTLMAHGLVCVASWPAQIATVFIVTYISGIQQLLFSLRALAFSPPRKVGSVQATYGLYTVFVGLISLTTAQGWIATLPDPLTRLQVAFNYLTLFASVGFVIYTCVFSYLGLPSYPVLLPEEVESLCRGFGCKNFHDVAFILHREHEKSTDEVVASLSSTDQGTYECLLLSIDKDRMSQKMQQMTVDELGQGLKEGFVWRKNMLESAVGGLNMRALLSRLGDLSQFGQGSAKTLEQFQKEIAKGRSRLVKKDGGQMQRIVDLVALRIYNNNTPSNLLLVQVAEQFPDGRKREKITLPGSKRNPDKDDLQTSVQSICVKVGIEKVRTSFLLEEAETSEYELESPSYPGVFTLYKKQIVSGYVAESDVSALAPLGLPLCKPFSTYNPKSNMTYFFEWMDQGVADLLLAGDQEKPQRYESERDPCVQNATDQGVAQPQRMRSVAEILWSLQIRNLTKTLMTLITRNDKDGLEEWLLTEKINNLRIAIQDLADWPNFDAEKVSDSILDMVPHERFLAITKKREDLKLILIDFFMQDLDKVQKGLRNGTSTLVRCCSNSHPLWPCKGQDPWTCETCGCSFSGVEKIAHSRCPQCKIDVCKDCAKKQAHELKRRKSI